MVITPCESFFRALLGFRAENVEFLHVLFLGATGSLPVGSDLEDTGVE